MRENSVTNYLPLGIIIGIILIVIGLITLDSSPSQSTISVQGLKTYSIPTPITTVIKPSDKSLRLSAYIFAVLNGEQRTEFIKKFSNGENDLKLAVNNLALSLDSKPEVLASVEKIIALDLAQKLAKNSQEDEEETIEYHKKEYQRLKELNDSLNTSSSNYNYIGGTQNTNHPTGTVSNPQWNGLSQQKPSQPLIPTQDTHKAPVRYDVIGESVYGSDGSRYDRIGDSIYRNDGTRYDIIGDSIYGNDGSRYDQIGDSVYKNDGTRYDAIGDTVYGSDGSRYYNIGDSIYAQPGN